MAKAARWLIALVAAIILSSLLPGGVQQEAHADPAAAAAPGNEVAAYRKAVEQHFAQWLESLWPDAQAAGVSRAIFDANIKGLKLNWSLPHLILPDPAAPGGPSLPKALAQSQQPSRQPEFDIPANYFKGSALNALAATGRAKIAALKPTLTAVQKQYNVPASIVVAIWGRETGFGKIDAPYDAISTLATQAFMGRRPDEFRTQLIAALNILDERRATRDELKSSWAGAMGYTQLLPTDFEKYAVDFDGDGKRDIWNSVTDSLASTANSLKTQGWDGSKTWGYEVKLPDNFDCTLQGPDKTRSIADWLKLGVARVAGKDFPPDKLTDPGFLVLPAGLKGPAFLATPNFSVLKLYNNSDLYAIFVGHVADMIATNAPAPFVGAWKPVERLPRDVIQRFQEALVAKGYDVGKVDGLAGFKTRAAIGLNEKKLGLPLTCYPSQRLVDRVLKETAALQEP